MQAVSIVCADNCVILPAVLETNTVAHFSTKTAGSVIQMTLIVEMIRFILCRSLTLVL